MFGRTPFGVAAYGTGARIDRYEIPAIDTPEGKQRLRDYHEALGRFMDTYARAEHACRLVLQHYAKLSPEAARALLSGVRTDEGRSQIKRLADIAFMPKADWADIEPTLQQLGIINKARNLIMHHGATEVAEGQGNVSDVATALLPERVSSFPISPTILAQMTADLEKIIIHLRAQHSGLGEIKPKILRDGIDARLAEPWQYMPPPSLQAGSNKQEKTDQPKDKARPDQPKPSQK
jgi:hypothetical protein